VFGVCRVFCVSDGSISAEKWTSVSSCLELVHHEGVAGLEDGLGHLVGLERLGVGQLLAAGLLTHLEVELGHLARGARAAHEGDGGVTRLQLPGHVQHLDLRGEVERRLEAGAYTRPLLSST